jgi:sugar lactone lactonase YvrE/thiol-disulfide isomerase/thioredoxin
MARVRAPEIAGGAWVNVAEPLSMASLRGRVVVLHFFTASCVHCQRVVHELRQVEARSGGDVVLVGVRTPRFDHERGEAALRASVRRLGLTHPVVDDPDAATWDRYGVRAWPTVVVVDGDGYVVGSTRGEGVGPAVEQAVAAALTSPRRAPLPRLGRKATPGQNGPLSWPAKVAVHPEGVVVADSGHDRVLVVGLDGGIVAEHGDLRAPHGVRAAPDGSLLVCERDADRVVRIAKTGGRHPVLENVASPWDVALAPDGDVFVAESGRHRIWRVAGGEATVLAGTGEEGLEDGFGPVALFAQPSGLAIGAQGLFVVDAESSALRVVDARNRVATLIGRGTATWGDADGPADTARLQHPEGVACAPDGYSVYVADTFNSSLRLWSGVDGELRTAPVEGLLEPGGVDVLADGRLVVADTGHHRVVVVDLAAGSVVPLAVG